MLTPPKWQTVWLKCQYSSRNISKKIMFPKPEEKILDDLSSCCNSASKELALEALSCWRMWIDNQEAEHWKLNETCYSAVRPLLTKKFHPLHRDGDVSEMKLRLLWLALHKTQGLMHLEGPQRILEVFIQSCLSWLSCSDNLDCNIRNLVLRLLKCLFLSPGEVEQENENFPCLKYDMWKSNKLFCRLLTLFLEIFYNWAKIKEKTDLLCIWSHFLGHCERSFKIIPVPVWHKIFKLIQNICSDDKELFKNKISLLHHCAVSLNSVLTNSKFIDCSQVLTTPAEALLKIVVELCAKNNDDNIPFEIFQYCLEICQLLSSRVILNFGCEHFIDKLSKIEDIESKPLLWGLWCGIANWFRKEVNDERRENYSKMELKLYRKLRSVAANFDLDKAALEEKCIFSIQNQLNFLRIPNICENCLARNERIMEDRIVPGITTKISTISSPVPTGNEGGGEFEGSFGFDVKVSNMTPCICLHRTNPINHSLVDIDEIVPENDTFIPQNSFCGSCRIERNKRALNYKWRWVGFHSGLKGMTLNRVLQLFANKVRNKRLAAFDSENQRGQLFAPACLAILLEELCNIAGKSGDSATESFVEKVKKVENKAKEGTIFAPVKLFVSFRGGKGVEFYSYVIRYWNDLNQIINDVDLIKNLNVLKGKNEKFAVWLAMFLFLVNFTKNLFFEGRENNISELKKIDFEEEVVLTVALISFMRNVTDYKTRLSNFAFLDNMNRILPKKGNNPLVIWTNFVSTKNSKPNESILEDFSAEESCKASNDNLINIFNYFDELERTFSKGTDSVKKGKKNVSKGIDIGRYSSTVRRRYSLSVTPQTEVKIMENESVTVVQAPPDVFRTMTFSDWRTTTELENHELICKENRNDESIRETPRKLKRGQRNKCEKEDETPRKRIRRSNANKTEPATASKPAEAVQDENVNIAVKTRKCRKSDASEKNFALSRGEIYSLRKRPLQRPSKYKGTMCLFADDAADRALSINCKTDARRSLSSPFDCTTVEVFTSKKSGKNFEALTMKSEILPVSSSLLSNTKDCDFETGGKLMSGTEDPSKMCSSNVHKLEVSIDLKVEIDIKKEPMIVDDPNPCSVISDIIHNIIEKIEQTTVGCENDVKQLKNDLSVRMESTEDNVEENPVSDSVVITRIERGVKRSWKCAEERMGGKKLKKEELDENAGAELERDVSNEEESGTIAARVTQKPVMQSRGSRILALCPELVKHNGFLESPPSSKHQAMKPPNVSKNSRASKMLALLPELQDTTTTAEPISFREATAQTTFCEDDNTTRSNRGYTMGIKHHLTPNRNGTRTGAESPKGSPLRQRRSIRFDDDRNETVTYFTDSPPCQTLKLGLRFRGSEK